MFGLKVDLPIGVDIGTSSVKMVSLVKDAQGYTVQGASRVEIPPSSSDDPDDRLGAITDAIRRCHHRLGTKSRDVVCGLSGPQLAVREFTLPSLAPEEIEAVVRLEAEQSCHLDINQSVLDFQLDQPELGEVRRKSERDTRPNEIHGFFAMADDALVHDTRQRLKSAGLHVVMLDIDNLALLNCLWECDPPAQDRSACVVDIGAMSTNVAIMGRTGAPCVRDLPYGSQQIIDDMVTHQGLSMELVDPLFQPDSSNQGLTPELQIALGAACARMMADIGSSLRYYRATGAVGPFEKIHLCGGLSHVDEVVSLLQHSLPVPVERWNPFDTFRTIKDSPGEELFRKYGLGMALATGLAMRCP